MTSPHKHLIVAAAKDGILLWPHHGEELQKDSRALKLAYGSASASQATVPSHVDGTIDAFGIVGILDLVKVKHLVVITNREQVAQIKSKPIYTITDIALIPLTSESDAQKGLFAARKRAQPATHASGYDTDESDYVEDEHTRPSIDAERNSANPEVVQAVSEPSVTNIVSAAKSAAQDAKAFGIFAQKWLAKGATKQKSASSSNLESKPPGLTAEQQQEMEQTLPEDEADLPAEASIKDVDEHSSTTPQNTTIETYSKRIIKNAILYYSSKSFYFSYDHNLSKRWSQLEVQSPDEPLHKRFETDFFWNKHLVAGLITDQQDGFILPLMQGFVGQRSFTLESSQDGTAAVAESAAELPKPDITPKEKTATSTASQATNFLITLVSRRSIKRAGLRYLRRGVDENGNVANSVETEQILSNGDWKDSEKSFSLLQLRGSIPLFFSQSPFSFKPLPQTFGSEATNREAFKKHFEAVASRYGGIQVASLVDKHGTEMGIGEAYEKTAHWLNDSSALDKQLGFEWFDFHKECKGMKFENVSVLISTLEKPLRSSGWTIRQGDAVQKDQTGILRTNCMDCLDRTNVTQSSVGGWVLQQQLAEIGFEIDLRTDAKSIWFNQLWADNGDAISRQYAGTAALKGDFTRTRKRNWTGALSDFSLTLNRYYNNIFGDYFLQTCIDYFLGYVGPGVFDDFESNMMTQDYALDVRRIRQNAIDVCIKIVLEDPAETLVDGWTLSCPQKANTLRTLPFEECVLLLTNAALYVCRFDWSSEKVGSFERVNLAHITELWQGPYITSALSSAQTDELRNVGFALHYDTQGAAIIRTNTRSLDNEKTAEDENAGRNEVEKQAEPQKDHRRLLAFKMLQSSASVSKSGQGKDDSEAETAKKITAAIADAMITAIRKAEGIDHLGLDQLPKVEEKPIIALADAKKSTGYIESIGYSLKKLVW